MIKSELIALLSETDKTVLIETLTKNGYDTVKNLTSVIRNNSCPDIDYTSIDADLIITFDLHTDDKVFITETEIFTRDDIINKFNLSAFGLEPESIFNKQKIGVIDSDYYIIDEEDNTKAEKVYDTKIYIGKEKWKDFMIAFRFTRSLRFISSVQTLTDEKPKMIDFIDKLLTKN